MSDAFDVLPLCSPSHSLPSLSLSPLRSAPCLQRSLLPLPSSAPSSLSPLAKTLNPKPIKVPHILSDSSPSSSPNPNFSTYCAVANSTYSSTPSQASSIWNWKNFYPPSPPESESFPQRRKNRVDQVDPQFPDHHHEKSFDMRKTQASEFSHRRRSGFVDDCDETGREEVQCSEWEDHYSTTTSSIWVSRKIIVVDSAIKATSSGGPRCKLFLWNNTFMDLPSALPPTAQFGEL